MYTAIFHSQFLYTPPTPPPLTSPSPRSRRMILSPVCTSSNGQSGDTDDSPPRPSPPDTLEIRFRRGASKRRQRKRQSLNAEGREPMAAQTAQPPKSWDEMTLSEKAIELYMGEKGLLFWLNKFAYASIFIVIGGWILFRFVGPSLNLYQLDSPPLSPNSMFKGS